jgi:addiction module HigA family antidote
VLLDQAIQQRDLWAMLRIARWIDERWCVWPLNGATGISPEMALRLSKALGTSAEFWYGMQVNYDLWQARKKFRGKVRLITQRASTAA